MAAPPPAPPPPPPPLDLQTVVATLRGGKANDAWVRSWLPDTGAAPERFTQALYAYAISKRRGLKSRLGLTYNLYQDLVVANLESKTPALFAKDGAAGYVPITYPTLHDRCTQLSATWKRHGCERGDSVCVLMPVGVDYVVAVLTALRMGLVVTTLEPHGPAYVRTRLEALKPKYTATNGNVAVAMRLPLASAHTPGGMAECPVCGSPCEALASALPVVAGPREGGPPPVASYAPDAPVFSLLSPFGVEPDGGALGEPVEITAGPLHASLLRDGLVVLGLEPADVLAAPGFDSMQAAPHLVLATLAAGACYAAVDEADLEGDPKLAERARISVLGVSPDLCERILARGAEWFSATGSAWFKELAAVIDVERWELFGRAPVMKKLPGFNVLLNAATGGIELFSPRAPTPVLLRAWPVPGRPWQLSEPAAAGVGALNNVGQYCVTDGKEPLELPLPRCLLDAKDHGYLFMGALDLGPGAQLYPRAEVARAAAMLPAVRHATVVVAPGHLMNDARTVLLVFTDDARGADGGIELPVTVPEIQSRILAEMGERFVPERIAIYPLRPRLEKGKIDESWCRRQFLSGALDAMARSEMFVLISRLGYIVAGGAPGE